MEQKNEIKNLPQLLEWINNSQICYVTEANECYFVVEAPNNADVHVHYEEYDEIDDIMYKTRKRLEDFDADEEFMELWSVDFANHNHFRPSQFITMLKEDEETFHSLAWKLKTAWQEQ
jgi:hypothetical protein